MTDGVRVATVLPPERDGLRASIVGGRLTLDGDIGGLNAELIYPALDAFTDAPSEGDDRSPAQRKADGLARMSRVAMGADPDTTMASLGAAIVVDWATFLAHLNREAFVRFGQMDGGFIGGLDPTDVETLLCDCTIGEVGRSLGQTRGIAQRSRAARERDSCATDSRSTSGRADKAPVARMRDPGGMVRSPPREILATRRRDQHHQRCPPL